MDALDLDTPALYVDLDVLERNIARMQEQCREWGVELRPHVKTHKIAEIAQMQLDAGAIGITVAKVGEAEVLPGDDVLVAYPLVKAKLPRLRELAKTRRVKVAVDSVDVARDLMGIETLVEIDVGVGRCGAQSPEQAVEIAKACSNFQGIFYWPSWLDEAGFKAACVKIDAVLDALSAAGFEAKIVSGGSTPGAAKTPLIPQTTEIRPGHLCLLRREQHGGEDLRRGGLRAPSAHHRRQHCGAGPVRDRRRIKNSLERSDGRFGNVRPLRRAQWTMRKTE